MSDTAVAVDENGTTTFTVSLAARPRGGVTIRVVSDDTDIATVTPATISVPRYRWNRPQTFTITGTDDTNSTNESTQVTISVTGSGWASLVDPVAVAVTVTDDDAVTELTVTCNAAAETITIAWPEDGAMEVHLQGPDGTEVWTDIEGSVLEASTDEMSGWDGFYPDGGELTVSVFLDDGDIFADHHGTFPCQ